MVIRKASPQEIEEIMKYSLIVMEEATMGLLEGNQDTARLMMEQVLNDDGYFLVYAEENVIKGWLGVGRHYNFQSEEMSGLLVELYVLPAYRRKGIAEKLLEKAVEELKGRGYKKALLNVYAGNPGKRLYERYGFYDVSTIMERKL